MPEIKLTGKPLAQRITDRLKNSGEGANPNQTITKGSGPTRVHHNLHHAGLEQPPPPNAQHDRDGNGWER